MLQNFSTTEVKHDPVVADRRSRPTRTYLMKDKWGASELRDYVVYEITQRFGSPDRTQGYKEQQIFAGFIKRWGAADAREIAEFIFDIEDGLWHNKPIDVFRFTAKSDPHFADVIADRIRRSRG